MTKRLQKLKRNLNSTREMFRMMPHAPDLTQGRKLGFGRALWQLTRMI